MYFTILLIHSISVDVVLDLSCSLNSPFQHPYNKVGNAKVLYIFSLVCFLTGEGFKGLLIIPVIWKNFYILTVISFSFSYELEQPR